MDRNIYTDGAYLKSRKNWHIEDSPWKSNNIISMLNNNNIQPKTVCEIGCGAGEILNQLYQNLDSNIEFIGYEISPQAYKMCKEKDRIKFFNADF